MAPLLELESGDPYIAAISTFWTEFEHWKGAGIGKVRDLVLFNIIIIKSNPELRSVKLMRELNFVRKCWEV